MKPSKRMPVWARLIAGLVGVVLLPGGIGALSVVRPLGYPTVGIAIGSVVTGAALLCAAFSGEWPLYM